MNETNKIIIDSIIQKAEKLCPDSLALIGIYGSAATGDTHSKSDLDLLILINDNRGYILADAFILDNTNVGYDIYCTSWDSLEKDSECSHAHLSKLMDSSLVYVKDPSYLKKLESYKDKTILNLSSDTRYDSICELINGAKKAFTDCILSDSISETRTNAGAVINYLLDALILSYGKYFKMGVKRTFDELSVLSLPFDVKKLVLSVISSTTKDSISENLAIMFKTIVSHITQQKSTDCPTDTNLAGTYEEMFSNWRNKMCEAAEKGDLFSSFMNTVSLQFMFKEISEYASIAPLDVMEGFDPCNLQKNADNFDAALLLYLKEYQKVGLSPKRYANVEEFSKAYLNSL